MKIHTDKKTAALRYWPLLCLLLVAALAALALLKLSPGGFFLWMHYFMGLAFCQFAMLKLFNISGFLEGFKKYDLLAKNVRFYGYIYPFIELLLGLLYLSLINPLQTYLMTVLLMSFSAIGVINALYKGLDVRCVCMGTVLNVPLSSVTLAEDIGMGGMAFFMYLFMVLN